MDNFGKELKTFLLEFLRSIEADIRLDAKLFSKIRGMIEELILVHFDYLHNQRKSLKRLPNSTVCDTINIIRFFVYEKCGQQKSYHYNAQGSSMSHCPIIIFRC